MSEFKMPEGFRVTYARTDRNPYMPDASMDHWRVTCLYEGRNMTLTYSKGSGHHGEPPTATEVFDTLCSDASYQDAADFEDIGLTNKRQIAAVLRQNERFCALMGPDFEIEPND
jgi:hypothetical protein